jgi:hypothetical protein
LKLDWSIPNDPPVELSLPAVSQGERRLVTDTLQIATCFPTVELSPLSPPPQVSPPPVIVACPPIDLLRPPTPGDVPANVTPSLNSSRSADCLRRLASLSSMHCSSGSDYRLHDLAGILPLSAARRFATSGTVIPRWW